MRCFNTGNVTKWFPLNIWRNNNVVVTSKRRHFDVIMSKWRRFDVIKTLLLRYVGNITQRLIWQGRYVILRDLGTAVIFSSIDSFERKYAIRNHSWSKNTAGKHGYFCSQYCTIFNDTRLSTNHGPLARYVQLRVVHTLGMPVTFSPPPFFKRNR